MSVCAAEIRGEFFSAHLRGGKQILPDCTQRLPDIRAQALAIYLSYMGGQTVWKQRARGQHRRKQKAAGVGNARRHCGNQSLPWQA